MTASWREVWRPAAAACALVLAIGAQMARDRQQPRHTPAAERLLYLRSATAVKRLTFGFSAIAADVYWIRAVQHYGGDRLSRDDRRSYELLQPLLDLTTTLDPFFTIAYRFGGIFLSEPPPGGPGRPDQAIALLEKGLAAEPFKWQYFHDIAFVHFWHRGDPVAAAQWFDRAATQPGAPNWIRPLAATVLSTRDRASARVLWQRLLDADQPWLRRTAARSLAQLQALDDCDALQVLVTRRATSLVRVTWATLITAGVLDRIPLDPTGVPYIIEPESTRVTLAPESRLNPLPEILRPH